MAHVHGAAAAAAKHAAEAGTAKALEHGLAGAAPAAISFHNVPQAAAGAAATSLAGKVLRNPWVLLGIGITVGYMIHKYRKDIVGAANRAAEKGKDFVLQQRENLEDIVADTGEGKD